MEPPTSFLVGPVISRPTWETAEPFPPLSFQEHWMGRLSTEVSDSTGSFRDIHSSLSDITQTIHARAVTEFQGKFPRHGKIKDRSSSSDCVIGMTLTLSQVLCWHRRPPFSPSFPPSLPPSLPPFLPFSCLAVPFFPF